MAPAHPHGPRVRRAWRRPRTWSPQRLWESRWPLVAFLCPCGHPVLLPRPTLASVPPGLGPALLCGVWRGPWRSGIEEEEPGVRGRCRDHLG